LKGIYTCKIEKFQENEFFSPVRTKLDCIEISIKAIRSFLIKENPNTINKDLPRIELVIGTMSRLFFFQEGRYYSIAFPFTCSLIEDKFEFRSLLGVIIDNKIISDILSVIKDEEFQTHNSLFDYYINNSDEGLSETISIIEMLLHVEPSYVRYDYDPKLADGRAHPLYHLDLNFSNSGTFKLGLNKEVNAEYFINIHNRDTDCDFIEG